MISQEQKIQPTKKLPQAKIQNNIPKSTLLNELRIQLGRQIHLRYELYSKKRKSVYHKVSLVGFNFAMSAQHHVPILKGLEITTAIVPDTWAIQLKTEN